MQEQVRAAFAEQTAKTDKRSAGRTDVAETPLEVRDPNGDVDTALHAWVHERLGRHLGKYAPQIERVQVRFGDENGVKGGVDKSCMVYVSLSKLQPVAVEAKASTPREAFDLAAGRAERSVRHEMERHGIATHRSQRARSAEPSEPPRAAEEREPEDSLLSHREPDLEALVAWELRTPSTEDPGVSADDLKVGANHTAVRNAKQNTEGMQYRLEDSTNGQPSRKSTRGSANHIKHANPLTQRTKAAVHSPQRLAEAARRGR